MQAEGRDWKSVLAELRKIREEDARYDDGGILCSMCTSQHPLAKRAHQMFLNSNLGDSGIFPGSQRLEKEVVYKLAALLHCRTNAGFIVSGGTEANLLALLAARNMSNRDCPEVIVPESAHFSFTKICNMLKIKPVQASLNGSFRVDPSSLERYLNKNTIAIVGTAGTAELGAVDPIGKLSDIAQAHGVWLHVDAAFGGLVIPFLENAGGIDLRFDFELEGVNSITVDPHKMGMATIPAGGILFRDLACLEHIKTETPYLTDPCQYTFVGTRTGASVAATWAVFESLGKNGYKRIVKRCMKLTKHLSKSIESLGFELVTQPTLNILAFHCADSKLLQEKLRQRGWFVSRVPRLNCIRVVVMPHLKPRHVEAFLNDLGRVA
ncbi:MAG TPA: tyrosine decarboxylase MfnA [Candidatus Bathyarchaeia archaeon]|nr:tyrosine decarboxylase MfnA [Candidatus Bathyarchaeia archaeon]